jgi:DNA polymerase I-like protein with 3'-5' exonuclease and polymerase domains
MDTQGYLTSILGRKFYVHGDNEQQILESRRQVFNAQMQGSVAHAMQNSLVRIHKKYPNCILTELHDSVVLCCKSPMAPQLIKDVSAIMLRPFDGLLENNPVFPLRVSVGNKWRNWKELRVYRV